MMSASSMPYRLMLHTPTYHDDFSRCCSEQSGHAIGVVLFLLSYWLPGGLFFFWLQGEPIHTNQTNLIAEACNTVATSRGRHATLIPGGAQHPDQKQQRS
jgi:hypothetical protein